ncbi:hypothetical protein M404DRAFT_1001640 [Pisolithus tinctorius Marx 270]|uniref:Uncharacterized protein n=1 Tax=Pisolithus tinctorius Marx 270 TaxID=870435 RepID=A0A0C3K070_PISTI|nr:hypothetical protein M404DRAFT_1001640 [Pisolithus tinctorius Marx 270]
MVRDQKLTCSWLWHSTRREDEMTWIHVYQNSYSQKTPSPDLTLIDQPAHGHSMQKQFPRKIRELNVVLVECSLWDSMPPIFQGQGQVKRSIRWDRALLVW